MRWRLLAVTVLFAAAAAAGPAGDAADAVLAAFRAGKDLRPLASRDVPDPWIVADELCARGAHDAAAAFAKAAPRADVEDLAAYVAKRRTARVDADRRARVTAVNTAFAARDFKGALDAVGAPEKPVPDDVVGIRLACARAIALSAFSRHVESGAAWRESGEVAERLGWLARAARAYRDGGAVAARGGALRASLALWERWLAVSEVRSDRLGAAQARGNMGTSYLQLGDVTRALALFERVLAELEALQDRVGTAWALGNLGIAYKRLGDFGRALSHCERALAIQEAVGDQEGAANTLGNMGTIYARRGDYEKAHAAFARVQAWMEARNDRVGLATIRNNIAAVHSVRGEYAKALSLHEHVLETWERLNNKVGATETRGNIGNLYVELGDYRTALRFYERALADAKALGIKPFVPKLLTNIAVVHGKYGEHGKELSILRSALAATQALGDKSDTPAILNSIGSAQVELGDYAAALSTLKRALAANQALRDRDGIARTQLNLGVVHSWLGAYAEAHASYERALAGWEAVGDRDGIVVALKRITYLRAKHGDWTGAIEAARRGVRELQFVVGGLGDEQAATVRERWSDLFSGGVRAGVGLDDPAQVLFFIERGRAGSLLDALGNRQRLLGFVIPAPLRDAEARARDRERVALHRYRRALARGEAVNVLKNEVEVSQTAIHNAVQRIQREAKARADLVYPEAASLAQVQATLGAEEALVLYALLEEDAYALVVTARKARVVTLGGTPAIDAATNALRRSVARSGGRGFDVSTKRAGGSFPDLGKRLRKLVVAPLGLKAKRVLVSPDGSLCYVPFSTLIDAEIAYVPSATTYHLLQEARKAKSGTKILALGDPDYAVAHDATELALYAGGQLTRLPASGKEAEAVGDVVLLGKQATLPGLRNALSQQQRWRAVHLACHGLVDPERPVLSALALSGGFLRCLDVYRMKIPADLVVLSACETAQGKVYRTEGVVGWTRAFLFAGSPRVLVSLWNVDDDATRVLMEEFYEHWKHEDTATALKSAQATVREHEQWRHPYFWAAWQLWGLAE